MTANGGPPEESAMQPGIVSRQQLESVIGDGDMETLLDCAGRLGQRLKTMDFATSDVRWALGALRQVEMTWPAERTDVERELRLLKARAAHRLSRVRRAAVEEEVCPLEELASVLARGIDIVLEAPSESPSGSDTATAYDARQRAFARLVSFVEAIVAYHRYHGGAD